MLLKMRGIRKTFGQHVALSNVDLDLSAGEVLGIVGENGAGKSTLIKALAGAHSLDAGTIEIDGKPLVFHSPAESIAAGVAVIYQELTIIPEMTVAENVFLGAVPRGYLGTVDRAIMNRRATELLESLGLHLDPNTQGQALAPGYQQMVEIARAVNRQARIVLMDEPSSYLSEAEVARLYEFIGRLKQQKIGLIYISHHLEEIFKICDSVMVLRDGKTVAFRPVKEWTSQSLVESMVNRSIEQFYPYKPRTLGDVVLSVENAEVPPRLQDVSFTLRRGEILGIAGVVGSGRSELLRAIFGAMPMSRGRILWKGKPFVSRSPGKSIRQGFVMIPEDRKLEGLMLDHTIESNTVLSVFNRLARFGFVNAGKKRALTKKGIERFNIVCRGPFTLIRQLSGGNQQKVIFARATAPEPDVYLMDEPTRGVDIGAKVEIYNSILQLAERGCSIILVSSELPELLGMSDRILVLNAGRVVADLPREEATHEHVLHLSTEENPPDEIVRHGKIDRQAISRTLGV
jgi:ABC-type sugar transport system ATPase subunit